MSKQSQSHIIAFIGTLLSMCLIFLLLWFLSVKAPVWEEDEGIVVAFGDLNVGGGMQNVSYLDKINQVEQIPAPATPSTPSNNDFLVQEDDETLVLAKQAEEKKRKEEEALRQRRLQEEARVEAERVAKEKALAEQKAREQEAIDRANQLAAALGLSGTTEGANGEATSAGSGAGMGNPVGKSEGKVVSSDSDRNAYVPGRTVKYLPKPSSDFKQDGDVVVRIWVDQGGNVTNAQAIDGSISDMTTKRLAVQAALKAKFTPGDTPQIGTITYIFNLN